MIGHSHGGNVAIEAANILVKKHKIPANEIIIVALNTPRESDIGLEFEDANLISINAKGDRIQSFGSDYGYTGSPLTKVIKNVDTYIEYDDQIGGLDLNHIGPSPVNVNEWFPKLIEQAIKNNTTDNLKREKNSEMQKKQKGAPWLLLDVDGNERYPTEKPINQKHESSN